MGYYDERRYNTSEILKPYDTFAEDLPITYAQGCVRHIAKPLNREIMDCIPNFGKIVTDPQVMPAVLENYDFYKKLLAIDLLYFVYGDNNAWEDLIIGITPEVADEIIMRFYPSNRNWWISEDGRGYVSGILDEPRQHHVFIEEMFGDWEKRRYHFQVSRVPCDK